MWQVICDSCSHTWEMEKGPEIPSYGRGSLENIMEVKIHGNIIHFCSLNCLGKFQQKAAKQLLVDTMGKKAIEDRAQRKRDKEGPHAHIPAEEVILDV